MLHVRRSISRLIVTAALGIVGAVTVSHGTTVDSAQMAVTGPSTTVSRHISRRGPFAIVLVIDAARFDELDLSHMPNVARLVAGGTQYSQAWVGQMPSITETSHATIGTGLLPSRHQILGDTWRIPGKGVMAPSLLNGSLTRTGYIGNYIRQTGSVSIAKIVHQRYPGSTVVALSAHKVYAADALGAGGADYVAFGSLDSRRHFVPSAIPGHAPVHAILGSAQLDLNAYPRQPGLEDWWTTTLAEKFLFKYHPRLMMVNLPEVDVLGHATGTNAAVMQPLMVNVDKQIGRLVAAYGRAGMLSQTYFIITSDHAMVPGVHTVDQPNIEKIIAAAGGHPLYVGHGDYCSVWLKDVSAVPRVAAALANANLSNVAAVFAKDSTGKYLLLSPTTRLADSGTIQAYSDLLSTFNTPASPDIVMVYDENTITMTPSFLKIGRKGDHGGASWGAQHIPLIVSGPGIKQAYNSTYPARLVDIAPTVETLLGVRPKNQDGVPLADAMVKPPAWATLAQSRETARLTDDVLALQREALNRPNTRIRK